MFSPKKGNRSNVGTTESVFIALQNKQTNKHNKNYTHNQEKMTPIRIQQFLLAGHKSLSLLPSGIYYSWYFKSGVSV